MPKVTSMRWLKTQMSLYNIHIVPTVRSDKSAERIRHPKPICRAPKILSNSQQKVCDQPGSGAPFSQAESAARLSGASLTTAKALSRKKASAPTPDTPSRVARSCMGSMYQPASRRGSTSACKDCRIEFFQS